MIEIGTVLVIQLTSIRLGTAIVIGELVETVVTEESVAPPKLWHRDSGIPLDDPLENRFDQAS